MKDSKGNKLHSKHRVRINGSDEVLTIKEIGDHDVTLIDKYGVTIHRLSTNLTAVGGTDCFFDTVALLMSQVHEEDCGIYVGPDAEFLYELMSGTHQVPRGTVYFFSELQFRRFYEIFKTTSDNIKLLCYDTEDLATLFKIKLILSPRSVTITPNLLGNDI